MEPRIPPSDGDRNFGPIFASLSVITATIGGCCVLFRVYIRVKWTHSFGWDDAFIIGALLIAIPETVFNVLSVISGAGRHQFYLAFSQISNTIKWNTASQIVNVPCITFTKISILLFILRIKNKGVVSWIVYISMAATLAINIPTVAVLAAQCRPLAGRWDAEIPAKCLSIEVFEAFGWAQGTISGITDLLISMSPVVILWNIQMRPRKKVAICALMSLGLIATAANIIRTVLIGSLSDPDYTFDTIGIAIASVLEANLGIIAACIPTMKPLFKWLIFIRTRNSRSKSVLRPTPSAGKSGPGIDKIPPRDPRNYSVIIDGTRKSDESILPLQDLDRDNRKQPSIGYQQTYEIQYSPGNARGSGTRSQDLEEFM